MRYAKTFSGSISRDGTIDKELLTRDLNNFSNAMTGNQQPNRVMSYRKNSSLVVILMGSPVDKSHCDNIENVCKSFALGIPIVFIAVAGRSNGLGPVLCGNTQFPVINCPPIDNSWGAHDIWSSLRLPSEFWRMFFFYGLNTGFSVAPKINPFSFSENVFEGRIIDDYSSILIIENVEKEHAGNYMCVASNLAASVSHSSHLSIHDNYVLVDEPEILQNNGRIHVFFYGTLMEGFIFVTRAITWNIAPEFTERRLEFRILKILIIIQKLVNIRTVLKTTFNISHQMPLSLPTQISLAIRYANQTSIIFPRYLSLDPVGVAVYLYFHALVYLYFHSFAAMKEELGRHEEGNSRIASAILTLFSTFSSLNSQPEGTLPPRRRKFANLFVCNK
uniref:Ig-like domain-containing protein n=1 Tax=Strigamia maritima TaxID=126957 RepID=T1JDI9_STRMM